MYGNREIIAYGASGKWGVGFRSESSNVYAVWFWGFMTFWNVSDAQILLDKQLQEKKSYVWLSQFVFNLVITPKFLGVLLLLAELAIRYTYSSFFVNSASKHCIVCLHDSKQPKQPNLSVTFEDDCFM